MVITVSLEGLVLVFETKLEQLSDLIYPTALLLVSAITVVALGAFQRLSGASVGNRIGRRRPERRHQGVAERS